LTESWFDSGNNLLQTLNFTYDSLGNLLTAQNANGTDTFTYDDLSRTATATDVFGLTLTSGYDSADNRTTVTDSLGGTETMSYDSDNRLSNVSFTATGVGLAFAYTYDARSDITQLKRYSNAAGTTLIGSTAWGYNGQGDITSITHDNAYHQTIQSLSFSYDSSNRLTSKIVNGATTNYSYDNTSQLTSDGTNNYSYDANGNRTMTGYTTGSGNELTSDGAWNYSYDNEGNLINKVSQATGETWNYFWDNHNQLTRVEYHVSNGGALLGWINYKYDALGRMVERDADFAGSGSSTVRYAYDGSNVWADLDGSNNLGTRRLYGPGDENPVVRISAGGTVVWYLLDYQNSVIGMVSATGASLGTVTYDGFGNVTQNTLGNYADLYMFQGAYTDASTGYALHNVGGRGRWYNPATGRWLSVDRGGFAMGDADLYRAMGNALTDGVDPTGKDEIKLPPPEFHGESRTELLWVTVGKKAIEPNHPGGSGITLVRQELYVKESWVSQEYHSEFQRAADANAAEITMLKGRLLVYEQNLQRAEEELERINRGIRSYGRMGIIFGAATFIPEVGSAAGPSAFICTVIVQIGREEAMEVQKQIDHWNHLIAETNKQIAALESNIVIKNHIRGNSTAIRESGWRKTGSFRMVPEGFTTDYVVDQPSYFVDQP